MRYMRPLALTFVAFLFPITHLAASWTQYRGSNQDGVAVDAIRTNWNETLPTVLWKKSLPFGLSSFSADDHHRLYTMGWRRVANSDTEFCIALDADTGIEIWAAPIGLADYPDGGVGSDDGPRSTPTVDGDLVIAFGSYMNLVCLNRTNGTEVWSHDLVTEFGAEVIPWQNAASPTVVGDRIFVNSSGGSNERILAFNKATGTVAWNRPSFGMTHATPVQATIAGTEQIIFLAQRALFAVDPGTGDILWQFPIRYNFTSVAASPVVVGDTVYISRAYPGSNSNPQAGALVLQITKANGAFTVARKWEKVNNLMNHWATPVHYNNHYYGVFGQGVLDLRCVDAETGDTIWRQSGVGYGSVTLAGDKLVVLEDNGELVLVPANSDEYLEIARFRPLNGRCWNNPAISHGRIYIRSTTEAVALDVAAQSTAPAPALKLAIARSSAGKLTIEVGAEDGTPLAEPRAGAVSVSTKMDLVSPSLWTQLPASTVLENGKLTLETDHPEPQRFFRTEEPK